MLKKIAFVEDRMGRWGEGGVESSPWREVVESS